MRRRMRSTPTVAPSELDASGFLQRSADRGIFPGRGLRSLHRGAPATMLKAPVDVHPQAGAFAIAATQRGGRLRTIRVDPRNAIRRAR